MQELVSDATFPVVLLVSFATLVWLDLQLLLGSKNPARHLRR